MEWIRCSTVFYLCPVPVPGMYVFMLNSRRLEIALPGIISVPLLRYWDKVITGITGSMGIELLTHIRNHVPQVGYNYHHILLQLNIISNKFKRNTYGTY